jgi:serine/threonine-protein kinase PpkA
MQLLNNEQFSSPVVAGDAGVSLLIIKKETLLANPAVYRSLLDQGLLIQGRDCTYVLGEKLGEGATGLVFEIEGHNLCAKIFRPKLDAAAGTPVSIPEEILRLRHPNIVSIHENISAHGAQFIIMDLAKGLTIRRKNGEPARCHNARQMMEAFQSEQQRVSLDMTAKVFRHVAAALLYIHEQGFVHRDVKPEHIFIDVKDNDISFMLSDFSLAFPISTRPGKIEGTPHYCPPEAISIEKPETLIAGSADFYSLAAVCFELLTGQTVFSCSNVLELAQQHLQAEPDLSILPSETPIWLGKFIEQALKKNPEERPAREEIEKLIAGA